MSNSTEISRDLAWPTCDARHGLIQNVPEGERWISALAGAGLIGAGLARSSFGGLALALLGAGLVKRGWTGHCTMYEMLSIQRNSTATPSCEPHPTID